MKSIVHSLASISLALMVGNSVKADGAKWLKVPTAGYVSITFDDATLSQYEQAFPILETAGLPATVYVSTGLIGSDESLFMNWDQVRELVDANWEIGSHSVTHQELPTLTDEDIFYEMARSQYELFQELDTTSTSFASPYGEYNQQVISYAQYFYESHVRAWGDNNGVNAVDIDPFLIERINIDNTLTSGEVCDNLRTVHSGQWLVLMFHQIGDTQGRFISSAQQLSEIVECLQDARQQNRLTVGTVSTVIALLKER